MHDSSSIGDTELYMKICFTSSVNCNLLVSVKVPWTHRISLSQLQLNSVQFLKIVWLQDAAQST